MMVAGRDATVPASNGGGELGPLRRFAPPAFGACQVLCVSEVLAHRFR